MNNDSDVSRNITEPILNMKSASKQKRFTDKIGANLIRTIPTNHWTNAKRAIKHS